MDRDEEEGDEVEPRLRIPLTWRLKWRNFEHESCTIALKITIPKKILPNIQPSAARIAPRSFEKSLF